MVHVERAAQARLTGGTSSNLFTLNGWTGTGTITGGGGGGGDRLLVAKDADISLNDSKITASDGLNFNITDIVQASLRAVTTTTARTIDSSTFTGWVNLYAQGGAGVTLKGALGSARFTLDGYTGTGAVIGSGHDAVYLTKDADFTLTNNQLTATGGTTVSLTGVSQAYLTGGASNNSFTLSGWTGTGSIAGGGGSDKIVISKDADITLTNAKATASDGLNVDLTGITLSSLVAITTTTARTIDASAFSGTSTIYAKGPAGVTFKGGTGNDNFMLDSYTGTGSINGGGGINSIFLTKDADFTLTNNQLTATEGPTMSLSGVSQAYLTGGASNNSFTLSGWTGTGSIAGGGGSDKIVISKDADITLTNAKATASDGLNVDLTGITLSSLVAITTTTARTIDASAFSGTSTIYAKGPAGVTLKGGTGNDNFMLDSYTGTGSITGGGGINNIFLTKDADFILTNAQIIASGGMTLSLSGIQKAVLTLANDSTARTVNASGFSGASTLTASGSAEAQLIGGSGNDTLNVTGSGSAILLGGDGDDILSATGTGRVILIGGSGADTLRGNGMALQISSSTAYDSNRSALDQILAEWSSPTTTYAARVSHILNGGGLNGTVCLTNTTVMNDSMVNVLSTSSAADGDWFVVNANDLVTSKANETKTIIVHADPLTAPTGLTATAAGASQINLSWSAVVGATGYSVERSPDGSTAWAVIASPTSAAYTDTGLSASTHYYYRVRASNAGGYSGYSANANATTFIEPDLEGDTLATALAVSLTVGTQYRHQATIGDGNFPNQDVDLYQVQLTAGQYLSIQSQARNLDEGGSLSNLDTYMRLFDASGTQVAFDDDTSTSNYDSSLAYTVPTSGTYYIGISNYTGRTYNPTIAGSAAAGTNTGAYRLQMVLFDSAPPATPTGLTATAAGTSQINLSWSAVVGATGHSVERSLNGSTAWALIGSLGAGVTTYSDMGLSAGTAYYYRLQAWSDDSYSTYSVPASATTQQAAPDGLTTTAISATRIDLVWANHAPNIYSTDIEQSPDGSTGWSLVASLQGAATSYSATGPFNGSTTYFFRVRTVSSPLNYSAYSSAASVTTPAYPDQPTLISATAQSDTAVALAWTDVADETGFRVERLVSGTWTTVGTVGAGVTAFTDTGLTETTSYTYRVIATNAVGDSAPSATPAVTTLLSAPTSLTANIIAWNRIDLAWVDQSSRATTYYVEQSEDGTTWVQVATLSGSSTTSYTATGTFIGATTYSFRVRAYASIGVYSTYATTSVTTPAAPLAPKNVTAVPTSDTSITVTWTEAGNADGYLIERTSDGASGWTQIGTTGPNQTTCYDTGLTEGTSFYYRVVATGFVSVASDLGLDSLATTLPTAPTGLEATAPAGGQVNLHWQDNSGVESGYSIEQWIDGTYQEILTVGPGSTDATIVGTFEPSTLYRFEVRAYATARYSGVQQYSLPSNEAQFTTGAWPAAPSNLAASAVSDSEIDLIWDDNASDETCYEIERSTDGGTWTQIATAPGGMGGTIAYTDSGLTGGEAATYSYRVRATKDGVGDSGYSNISQATTLPATPTNLEAVIVDGSQANLTWSDQSAIETSYIVEQWIDGDWQEVQMTDANAGSVTVPGPFEPSTQYTFRVRASTETNSFAAYSAPSNEATITAPACPAAPTNLTTTVVSNTRIDLTWVDNAADETGYVIDRSTDGETWTVVASALPAGTQAYSDTGLVDGTMYEYRVRAVNDIGGSDYATGTAATLPTAPTNLQATVVSGTEIDLSWTASDYATGYTIWKLADNSDTWELVDDAVPSSQTTYAVTGLTPGGTYYAFAVMPTNSSAPSTIAYLEPPTLNVTPVISGASAGANSVTTTSTTLSVAASDDQDESNLIYSWSIISAPGADSASFSSNDSNDAKNATVVFHEAGDYTFRVTVADSQGLFSSNDVTVTVQQTLTGIALTPGDAVVLQGTTRQFAATAIDQFGNEMDDQPTFSWSVGVGSIDSSGLYTAPSSATDTTFTVSASADGKSGTANLAVESGGVVYVQATDVHQIKVFNDSGALVKTLPFDGPFPANLTFRNAAKITLADGSYLDASQQVLVRRNAAGTVIQTYISGHAPPWTGMVLDPDGTSFWACDYSCYVYKFNIATGAVLLDFYGSGSLAEMGILREPLLELTVADHAAPTANEATAITDQAINDLYVSENLSTESADVDISALFDPDNYDIRRNIQFKITRNDGYVAGYGDFSDGSTMTDVVLPVTDSARDFVITAFMDSNGNGVQDNGENARAVGVHVISLRSDNNGDGMVNATDDKLNAVQPTALDLEGNGPRARTEFDIKIGAPGGNGRGYRIVVPNVAGLVFWTDATGGFPLKPDANGDIIDEALPGGYTRTIWVSAASSTTFSATAPPAGATGDLTIKLLIKNQAGQSVAQTSLAVNKPVQVLYAVGGTWEVAADNFNVRQFEQRYQGVDGVDKFYYDGPGPKGNIRAGIQGNASPGIVTTVEQQIEKDYMTAFQKHRKLVIDMVGWSRGGVIVATVAEDLDTVVTPPAGGIDIIKGGDKSISVHWVGLFDAVNRMGGLVNNAWLVGDIQVPAPNNPWAWELTDNVVASSHLVKSSPAFFNNLLYHTVMTLGTPEYLPNNNRFLGRLWRGLMLDHGYIGTKPEALNWMIRRARQANVPVK